MKVERYLGTYHTETDKMQTQRRLQDTNLTEGSEYTLEKVKYTQNRLRIAVSKLIKNEMMEEYVYFSLIF